MLIEKCVSVNQAADSLYFGYHNLWLSVYHRLFDGLCVMGSFGFSLTDSKPVEHHVRTGHFKFIRA